MTIQQQVIELWNASTWKYAASNKCICRYSLYDDKNNLIITDTLLNLKWKGLSNAINK